MIENEIIYKSAPLPEYEGNPLIEALPDIASDDDVVASMFRTPEHSEADRSLPRHLRAKCLLRLQRLVCPTPLYLDFHRKIEDGLLESYLSKHPFSPTTAHWIHYVKSPGVTPATGAFESRARITTLIGESGAGKTTMIRRVLSRYPRVLRHTEYQQKKLPITQIVHLYVECPESASIKAFCGAVFKSIDKAIGSTYRHDTRNYTISDMQDELQTAVRTLFIGLIIIDEFQNISVEKSGGRKSLMAFLLRLANESGVPFVIAGTPELKGLLSDELRMSRRFEAGGFFYLRPLDWTLWQLFIKQLWRYQWTSVHTPLEEDLSKELFRLSKGMHDFAVRFFARAQELVMFTNSEVITNEALREAADIETNLSKKQLSYLPGLEHDSDPEALAADYDSDGDESPKDDDVPQTGDQKYRVDEIQHPEFRDAINAARKREHLIPNVVPLDTVQNARLDANTVEALEKAGYLVPDLLNLPHGQESKL